MKNKLARVRLGLDAKPLVPLLGDGELHSLALGSEMNGLLPLPMTNTWFNLVANTWPWESLMCTISNDPGCFSLEIIVPTRPALAPPVTMQRLPTSKVMMSCTLLVAKSSWMLSFTFALGSGYRMVRPSLVCRYGTPLGPVETALTLQSL